MKKKIMKVIAFVIIAALFIAGIVFGFKAFTMGKLTSGYIVDKNYYAKDDIVGVITSSNDHNCNVVIELLDSNGKKVKKAKTKIELESYQDSEFKLDVPDDLKTGNYTLRMTLKSGLYRDVNEQDISIIDDTCSNINVSFDKGIYKPGDEVNYRVLLTAKKDNKPVDNQEINIEIYDGNDNRVRKETLKTSEYGIASCNFKLADEVNSGTYRLTVSSDAQSYSKNFVVKPYVVPMFETTISKDKEIYKVGDKAQIVVANNYFFGEPVVGSKVKLKIGDKTLNGLTDFYGNANFEYEVSSEGVLNLDVTSIDSSNYVVEKSDKLVSQKTAFTIEVLPELGFILDGRDNTIYIVTKDVLGNPVKTYSSVTLNGTLKQVISDESGIGKVTFNANEIGNSTSKYSYRDAVKVQVISKDMNGVEVKGNTNISKINASNKSFITTDKVKYDANESVNVSVIKGETGNSSILVYKNKELIKTITTDQENIDIDLEGLTGLIDIYLVNQKSNYFTYRRPYIVYDDINYVDALVDIEDYTEEYIEDSDTADFVSSPASTSYNGGYTRYNYSKRTIFVKPDAGLAIDVAPEFDEYEPKDNLKVSIDVKDSSGKETEAALLVSIIDDAILSLADNDLSIDNIKLALQDIKFDSNISAADVYAELIDDKSDTMLRTILLRQNTTDIDLINRARVYNYDAEDYLGYAILFIISGIAFGIFVMAIGKSKKAVGTRQVLMHIVNLFTTFIISAALLYEIAYDLPGPINFAAALVITLVLYLLILYKERQFMFSFVFRYFGIPFICYILMNIYGDIFYYFIEDLFGLDTYGTVFGMILDSLPILIVLAFVAIATLVAFFGAKSKKEKVKNVAAKAKKLLTSLLGIVVFWIACFILGEYFEFNAILIVMILAILFEKLILKKTGNKLEQGKIVLNLNISEVIGITIGFIILIVLASMLSISRTFSGSIKGYDDGIVYEDAMNDMVSFDSVQSSGSYINKGFGSTISNSMNSMVESSESDVARPTETTTESETQKQEEQSDNIRNVFLESLAFIPETIAKNGHSDLELKISDNITSWSIQVVGNSKQGDVGSGNSSFTVKKDFFVDFTTPKKMVVGDKVSIPVTVYNYSAEAKDVTLTIKADSFATVGEYENTVNVEASSTKMVYVPLSDIKLADKAVLRVEGKTAGYEDIVEKNVKVYQKGVEISKVVSNGIIDKSYSEDFIFEEKAIDGSAKLKVKLYPSVISQMLSGMDSMLRMPSGCFEQTSSSLYPDALVLDYLIKSGDANSEIRQKAYEYISSGYQRLLTYEVMGTKGGYSLYGSSPAEPVLTSFGLTEMQEISKVYEIDENVIPNMIEYLFGLQKSNGTFDASAHSYILDKSNKYVYDAYITWALSEVCPKDERLSASISYLEKNYKDIDDPYTLALVGNALSNVKSSHTSKVIKKLESKTENQGGTVYFMPKTTNYWGSCGRYLGIETTALTSMLYTKESANTNTNRDLIKYLAESKDSYGNWHTTQGTILALKAINLYNDSFKIKDKSLNVTLNDNKQTVELDENNMSYYVVEFDNIGKENKVSVDIKNGKIMYEIIEEYNVDYDVAKETMSNDINVYSSYSGVPQIDGTLKYNVTENITQTITVESKAKTKVENMMVEVEIPQGMVPNENSLLKLVHEGKIEKYEYNYDKIEIYLRRETNKNTNADIYSFDIEYLVSYPGEFVGATVKAYDYYNPDVEGISDPAKFVIE